MQPSSNGVAYLSAMRRYATFSGRSTRSEYWYFTLSTSLMSLGAALLDDAWRTGGILYLIVALVHAIPSLSVFVRRMHDTDRTGWWFLTLLTVIGVIPVLVFLCQRGTPGANRYGAAVGPDGRPLPLDAVPASSSARLPARDPIGEVERLAELRARGAISDAEFERMKAAVFAAPGTASQA